ncbi:MAG: putative metallo-dependent phosphatase [Phenylobacterium sp.]|nr:putative metallo-dependent phosphatase [Phenylobacterium sp.]
MSAARKLVSRKPIPPSGPELVLKFGIVSDIHNNVEALDRALELMGGIDELLCLGDIVSQTRFSNETVARLRERAARVVLGNHDVEYLKYAAPGAVARGAADAELVEWLRAQPERQELEVAGKRLLMVHATPWTYDYVYPGSPEMKRFAEVEADFVLGGHTHTPYAGRIGRALVVNPGSTGQGRFQEGRNLLSCAVLDAVTDEVRLIDFPELPLDWG